MARRLTLLPLKKEEDTRDEAIPLNRDPFYDAAARAMKAYRHDRLQRELQGTGAGLWGFWQHDKIMHDEPLPRKHLERFDQFISEMAPVTQTGEQHLHAYYDRSRRQVYWALAVKSRICKVEGRCKKVIIQDPDELYRH